MTAGNPLALVFDIAIARHSGPAEGALRIAGHSRRSARVARRPSDAAVLARVKGFDRSRFHSSTAAERRRGRSKIAASMWSK